MAFLKNGAKETRTPDPLHAMQVLYQLSYGPISTWRLQSRRCRVTAYTAGASDLPPHSNQATLHLHLFSWKLNRLISGVGSFENHRRPLAMEMLERGATKDEPLATLQKTYALLTAMATSK